MASRSLTETEIKKFANAVGHFATRTERSARDGREVSGEERHQQLPFAVSGFRSENMVLPVGEVSFGLTAGLNHSRDQSPRHLISPNLVGCSLSDEDRIGEAFSFQQNAWTSALVPTTPSPSRALVITRPRAASLEVSNDVRGPNRVWR